MYMAVCMRIDMIVTMFAYVEMFVYICEARIGLENNATYLRF